MAMTAVYYFVFKVVLQVKIPHHLVFILSGILVWNFIGQTLLEGMESIAGNIGLLTKVPIPIQVFPYVGALTNFVTLLLSFPILLGIALATGAPVSTSLVSYGFYALILLLMTYGLSLIFAILFIRLRDLRHLMGIGLQVWFYATPVIYDESMIPEKYKWVMYINPFAFAFADLHSIWVRGEWPNPQHLTIILCWTIGIILSAALIQKYFSKGLVEQI
jgi:ABC-type polysaccharide/polyol phosphate export permease